MVTVTDRNIGELLPELCRLTGSDKPEIRVWPTPADEQVYIQLTGSDRSAADYSNVSLTGLVIAYGNWPDDGFFAIGQNNAPSGIYLINLLDETGMVLGQLKIVWQ